MCDNHGPGTDLGPSLDRRTLLALAAAAVSAIPACSRYGADGTWYTCTGDDTLSGIARRSGITVEAIVDANRLGSIDLYDGQRLWLPGVKALREDPRKPVVVPAKPEVKQPDEPKSASGGYELVPRSVWTSESVGTNCLPLLKISRLSVHHTDEHAGMAQKSDIDVIRSIERYHRQEKKWAAIGYHFLVGRDGKVYEGRPLKFQGAHTSGENEESIGVSVIGNFMNHLPSSRQLSALKAVLDDLRTRHGINRNRVRGHREWRPGWTQCPGDALLGVVQSYRSA